MPNEIDDGIDRYPATGGKYWLMVDRNHPQWWYTLRVAGRHPLGYELATFNPYLVARTGGPSSLHPLIDRLNKEE